MFKHLLDHYIRTDTNMHTWAAALRERTQQPQQQGAGRENASGEGMATSDAAGVLLLVQAWAGGRLEEPRWQADQISCHLGCEKGSEGGGYPPP